MSKLLILGAGGLGQMVGEVARAAGNWDGVAFLDDAVRGADVPDLEAGVAAIREVWKTLPRRPGVYRMQDARGDVLYVGKARALKNRVTNYTQVTRLPRRLQRMVAQTRSMTIVTTNNEAEALLLEAQLIKRFRPAYESRLESLHFEPAFDLDGALARARAVTGRDDPGAHIGEAP